MSIVPGVKLRTRARIKWSMVALVLACFCYSFTFWWFFLRAAVPFVMTLLGMMRQ